MMVSLQHKYGFSLPDDELDAYVARELGKVVEMLEAKAQPCAGALAELERLHRDEAQQYGLAVVSSSALPRVQASLRTVGMERFFRADRVFSAASSLEKPTSKPDPAIYLHACAVVGVEPGACVAVEDSRSGAMAARNAGIPLIGYVGAYEDEEERERMARLLTEECGAVVVMRHWREFPECLRKVEETVG